MSTQSNDKNDPVPIPLPFDEVMRRALTVKPDKPKKVSRPRKTPKKQK